MAIKSTSCKDHIESQMCVDDTYEDRMFSTSHRKSVDVSHRVACFPYHTESLLTYHTESHVFHGTLIIKFMLTKTTESHVFHITQKVC